MNKADFEVVSKLGENQKIDFYFPKSCFLPKKGTTWGVRHINCTYNMTYVSCAKNSSTGTNCNPYQGDTLCRERRPILCINKTKIPRPPYNPFPCTGCAYSSQPGFYSGWGEGHLKLTYPVRGCYIDSKQHADNICEKQFGCGYKMASHHDGRWMKDMDISKHHYISATFPWSGPFYSGGWNFWAHGQLRTKTRFWIYINNQNGNCWN